MINIKTDSRRIVPGDTFVALPGINSDGHNYIDVAIKNGATRVIATHGTYGVETLIVPDTRIYLEEYLKDNYNKYLDEMTMIGITGTNGKTTACYLIYQMLNMLGKKCAYIGTIGYYLDKKVCNLANTSPDICDMYEYIINAYDLGYRYVSLEASSQGLFLGRINNINFDYAVFTNLTHSHKEFHPTVIDYALAKQLLFKKIRLNGKAIVNIDDEYSSYYLLEDNNNITYGFKPSDYQLTDYYVNGFNVYFSCLHNQEKINIHTKLIGKYNVYNLITCIIILKDMGINDDTIQSLISKLKEPEGRMEMTPYKDNLIIVDYAHTPDGYEKAIAAVREITKGKLYTVFSCRGNRDRTMRPLITKNALSGSDYGIVTTDTCYDEDPKQILDDMLNNLQEKNYEIVYDRNQAIVKGIDMLNSNDVLLILGRGHEDTMNIKGNIIHQNDSEVARAYIEKLTSKVS